MRLALAAFYISIYTLDKIIQYFGFRKDFFFTQIQWVTLPGNRAWLLSFPYSRETARQSAWTGVSLYPSAHCSSESFFPSFQRLPWSSNRRDYWPVIITSFFLLEYISFLVLIVVFSQIAYQVLKKWHYNFLAAPSPLSNHTVIYVCKFGKMNLWSWLGSLIFDAWGRYLPRDLRIVWVLLHWQP